MLVCTFFCHIATSQIIAGGIILKERIIKMASEMQECLIEWRQDFHKYPELAWTEFRTASIVANYLEAWGYKVLIGEEVMDERAMKCIPSTDELKKQQQRAIKSGAISETIKKMNDGRTAVIGELSTSRKGPTIALRFDMDGLPITESTKKEHKPNNGDNSFRSLNDGIMHACAHDGHAAIGLGIAKVLSQISGELCGTVKLIFQPAEEGLKGAAKSIIKKGIVDDVDYIFGFHIGLTAKAGDLFCGTTGFLAVTCFDVNFTGKSAHAGVSLEDSKSALLAAAITATSLQGISRHSKGASRINIGALHSGTAVNIVPDKAFMMLETRGATNEINEFMCDEVYRMIEASSKMYDVKHEIDIVGEAISAECNTEMVTFIKQTAEALSIFENVESAGNFGASEDFTYFMDYVQKKGGKALHCMIGADLAANHHNELFDFDEDILWKGVALFAMATYGLTKLSLLHV